MGRGDKRSRKGKIWRGTSGKSRPAGTFVTSSFSFLTSGQVVIAKKVK